MKKSIIVAAVAVVVTVGIVVLRKGDADAPATNLSASSATEANNQSKTTKQTNLITISDFAFSPTKLTVKKGTTVTWTNSDNVKHDVSPDDQTADFRKSELLSKGESYSVTFNSAGTYAYHCTPHPNMTGVVEVTE